MCREFGCVWRLHLRTQGAGDDTPVPALHFLCPTARLYLFLTGSQEAGTGRHGLHLRPAVLRGENGTAYFGGRVSDISRRFYFRLSEKALDFTCRPDRKTEEKESGYPLVPGRPLADELLFDCRRVFVYCWIM